MVVHIVSIVVLWYRPLDYAIHTRRTMKKTREIINRMYADYIKVKNTYLSCRNNIGYYNGDGELIGHWYYSDVSNGKFIDKQKGRQKLNHELCDERLTNTSRMAQNMIDKYAMEIEYHKMHKKWYRFWWTITGQRKKKMMLANYIGYINNSLKHLFDDTSEVHEDVEVNIKYDHSKKTVGF